MDDWIPETVYFGIDAVVEGIVEFTQQK